ncbi:RecB family exonuclease [Alicyclobacillus acidocaldarius]|uniref:PD-(D/E)XK endonuclease-like domain-containing protein n=1 Tax=Alicyclobacillus acidocaldarius subsp. acidocaldarius (strain ATCC 27009 / DSM 446 / BCRC 14685 / JCM 5260 / KCTC 1825 / NBRC 15652 / NCIMB 11725 / NRRL B-14509 / 104-IA) TaxID=521098 RepID=C8WVI8_ALIAD|nr:PD-(D/E)XK nuclease family protein [Alicyclobacillus acidocaldarius]ACV58110.1 hypothetical protein Aaci_1073 [Alicyclobacillus acidocaldarius subsp. acidocaldarius DSM 446]
MVELLTHSRIAMRQTCPTKERLWYVERLRPREVSWALSIGTAWHTGLEVWQRGEADEDGAVAAGLATLDWIRPENDEEAYKLQLERIRTEVMIRFAIRHFKPRRLVAVEKQFEIPILNPATGRKSRKFRLSGKIDALCEDEDGNLWILENKTTASIEQFKQSYGMSQQLTLYVYAASRVFGRPIAGSVVRALQKSRMEPKHRNGEQVETWEDFRDRLLTEYEANPDKYLSEDEVVRTEEQIRQFENELWLETQERLWQAKTGITRHNTANCHQYGGCPFLPICLNVEGARESMFYLSTQQHDELSLNETA